MLQSLRTCAISIATASLLASGIHGVIAPSFASAGTNQAQGAAAANVPVRYLTSGSDVSGVELQLSGAKQQVKVRLSADGRWYSCVRDGSVARCDTPGQTVQALDSVEIANV
ncbi:MAG: hypothetical protein ACYDHO_07005 [Gaiellaceae bacterium]